MALLSARHCKPLMLLACPVHSEITRPSRSHVLDPEAAAFRLTHEGSVRRAPPFDPAILAARDDECAIGRPGDLLKTARVRRAFMIH
jgi:hypothetical protein